MLIGADGLKSVVRGAVVGSHFHSAPSGHSAYRALIPAGKVESDPDLAGLGLMDNRITMVNGGDRRIICYPTRNRNLLNFVCALRPCPCFMRCASAELTADTELNEISEEKWSAKGDPKALVKSFSSFDPIWQKLLS